MSLLVLPNLRCSVHASLCPATPDVCAQAVEWRPGFLCPCWSQFYRWIHSKLFSACMGWYEFLSIDYERSSWCLLQEAMSAFGQLNATHTQILVPPGTAMLLGSFWNRESPQGQPTSDMPLTPCCGFVFQRLGRLRLLWRVNDRNNNKQRTSEMAGLMCYMWKVPGVCPLKTVWILRRERARHLSRQLALGKLCCCSHGEWHRVSNKTLEHVLNF